MSATSFFGGEFFGGEFFNTPTPTTRTIDTHDGFDSRKREDAEKRDKRDALRQLIGLAVDPDGYTPAPEVMELAAPFVERLESGRIEIDWERLERENVIRARLYAMAEEFHLQQAMDEDEEDVLTLLLH